MAEWLFLMFFVFHSNMQIKLKAFQGDAHEDLWNKVNFRDLWIKALDVYNFVDLNTIVQDKFLQEWSIISY